jgi:hypothetical protein
VVIFYFGVWLQEAKKISKRASREPNENNKFYILNESKHDPEKIWYFILILSL